MLKGLHWTIGVCAVAAVISIDVAVAATGCVGRVTESYVYANGDVGVRTDWNANLILLCNIKSEWKGVTPDVCALWVAKADAAVTTQLPLNIRYAEDFVCEAAPTYASSFAPTYVRLYSQ